MVHAVCLPGNALWLCCPTARGHSWPGGAINCGDHDGPINRISDKDKGVYGPVDLRTLSCSTALRIPRRKRQPSVLLRCSTPPRFRVELHGSVANSRIVCDRGARESRDGRSAAGRSFSPAPRDQSDQPASWSSREYRSSYFAIGKATILQGAECAAVADDDLTGDGLESSPEVLHRFERNDGLVLWIDAERFELLQVEHLLRNRDDQNLDAVHPQNSTRTERSVTAPRQSVRLPRNDRRLSRSIHPRVPGATTKCGVEFSAENHARSLADLGSMKLLNRLPIHHRAEAGIAHAPIK